VELFDVRELPTRSWSLRVINLGRAARDRKGEMPAQIKLAQAIIIWLTIHRQDITQSGSKTSSTSDVGNRITSKSKTLNNPVHRSQRAKISSLHEFWAPECE
jgi:hypothetical protein